MQLYKKKKKNKGREGGREGSSKRGEIQISVFSVVEYLPSLCNREKQLKHFRHLYQKKRMIVNIRVLSKRKMSFYNSVHYCQGNAGILDLYSTLSVRLCVCVCVCVWVCLCVCVVVPNIHITLQLFLGFGWQTPHYIWILHSSVRPSVSPSSLLSTSPWQLLFIIPVCVLCAVPRGPIQSGDDSARSCQNPEIIRRNWASFGSHSVIISLISGNEKQQSLL